MISTCQVSKPPLKLSPIVGRALVLKIGRSR